MQEQKRKLLKLEKTLIVTKIVLKSQDKARVVTGSPVIHHTYS